VSKQKRKKPKLYTLEQVVLAVNHWSMTTVQTENVKQFINGEVKNDKQLELFHNRREVGGAQPPYYE